MTISQMAAVAVNMAAEIPWCGQGEIDAKPSPDPSTNSTTDKDAATKAPAMMAPHDAAEIDSLIVFPNSVVRAHRKQKNDRKGNA